MTTCGYCSINRKFFLFRPSSVTHALKPGAFFVWEFQGFRQVFSLDELSLSTTTVSQSKWSGTSGDFMPAPDLLWITDSRRTILS